MSSNDHMPNYSPNAINYQSMQSHAPVREIVTVFWDYENCPCPMSTKLASLTKEIKRRIDVFIGKKLNKRIQLYCPMQRLHQRTRENATDLGILMMDVASKRKQESVDKRIIADIGLFAAELAESSGNDIGHIVLVSGDSDYGYILARLRDKSYIGKIIIFINDYTKETLTQHADYTHCLFQSNLTRKENPFSDYNQRKIPSTNSHKINSNYNMSINGHGHGHHSYNNQYSPYNNSGYNVSNGRDRDRDRDRNQHFQLDTQQISQWTTTYPNFPYNNNNNTNGHISTPDMYTNGHTHRLPGTSKSSNSLLGHHHSNGQLLNSNGKNKRNRSRSPHVRYTQSTVKILKKENTLLKSNDKNNSKSNSNSNANNNSNSNNNSSGGTYVYRRKEHKSNGNGKSFSETHISHIRDRDREGNNKDNKLISAPAPIAPPTPSKLVASTSGSSGSSTNSNKSNSNSSHRIVSQENLEEQLKLAQKEKRKNGSPPNISINGYANSAEIDGICNNNSSTFPVGSLYKINECNDDESKHNNNNNNNNNKDKSPQLKPNKLNFDIDFKNEKHNGAGKNLTNDFFDSMITPNANDMNKLLKTIAPSGNILHNKNKKLKFTPKTSHIIDLKRIHLKNNTTNNTPKKIILKKSSTNSNNNTTTPITDQLRLVWDALSYCQKNSNNTPRRREIYKAMKKIYPSFMIARDQQFAEDCIDACLSYGTVEEMIKGRIQSLFILPVVLNALTSKDTTFYNNNNNILSSDHNKHIWITLNALKAHLKSRYTNHLSTYFTLTYLYRIISNPTRLFAFHKDDKHKNYEQLSDKELGKLRFRVRKGAYHNTNKQNNYNQYNNNLTFNYYS